MNYYVILLLLYTHVETRVDISSQYNIICSRVIRYSRETRWRGNKNERGKRTMKYWYDDIVLWFHYFRSLLPKQRRENLRVVYVVRDDDVLRAESVFDFFRRSRKNASVLKVCRSTFLFTSKFFIPFWTSQSSGSKSASNRSCRRSYFARVSFLNVRRFAKCEMPKNILLRTPFFKHGVHVSLLQRGYIIHVNLLVYLDQTVWQNRLNRIVLEKNNTC